MANMVDREAIRSVINLIVISDLCHLSDERVEERNSTLPVI